jgi:hypothetical protein
VHVPNSLHPSLLWRANPEIENSPCNLAGLVESVRNPDKPSAVPLAQRIPKDEAGKAIIG